MNVRTLLITAALALITLPSRADAPPSSNGPGEPLAIPWSLPTGRGVSLGPEIGAWGRGFGSGLRIRVPFIEHWGAALRGGIITGSASGAVDDVIAEAGGRLDLYGQSPVFLNLVRLYGGGGVQTFYELKGPELHTAHWGGGGQFGFGFFMSPHQSFFLEVGGNGGGQFMQGATILAGMHIYPF